MSIERKYLKLFGIRIKTALEIEKMKHAGEVASTILSKLCDAAKIGVTTKELDQLSLDLHRHYKATSASLGYGSPPFPGSICTSKNEVICHGIPDDQPLVAGDILNIDVACRVNGYYGDCSRMITLGEPSEDRLLVVKTAKEALDAAIQTIGPGKPLSSIGAAIQKIADRAGCSIVRQFIGHGIGSSLHEEPSVYHYQYLPKKEILLVPGMTFTIEPMINRRAAEALIDPIDGWTARTIDGEPSAQWEQTICITDEGVLILTPFV